MGVLGQADSDEPAIVFFLAVAVAITSMVICVQKGKPELAILGVLFFPVAIVGAIRIAKPESRWARRHYAPGSEKARLSNERFPPRLLK
ncbi:MAG: hypothetical protein ACE5KX_03205 [Acidimicrobiia bacterium]